MRADTTKFLHPMVSFQNNSLSWNKNPPNLRRARQSTNLFVQTGFNETLDIPDGVYLCCSRRSRYKPNPKCCFDSALRQPISIRRKGFIFLVVFFY